MKKILSIIFVLFMVGCKSNDFEKSLGFEDKTTEEIIYILNNDSNVRNSVSASINGTELVIKNETEEITYEVGDLFYVAVAPYKTFTHT